VIRAAGGVLRRDGLVAVVHRPQHADWSLPKGKLEEGEDERAAAVREVLEETGWRATIDADLGTVTYTVTDGRPKVVRYFLMTADAHESELANDVDDVRWVPFAEAGEAVEYDTDRDVLARAQAHL
jgi:8-oxo-dGTP diphosphatase